PLLEDDLARVGFDADQPFDLPVFRDALLDLAPLDQLRPRGAAGLFGQGQGEQERREHGAKVPPAHTPEGVRSDRRTFYSARVLTSRKRIPGGIGMSQEAARAPETEAGADGELVIALQKERSTPAFEALVRRYQRALYGFIARQLGDRARAEDVFQQSVFQIYSRINTCARPEAFKAWAFGVAANACRNAERSERLRAVEPLSGADTIPALQASPNRPPPPPRPPSGSPPRSTSCRPRSARCSSSTTTASSPTTTSGR